MNRHQRIRAACHDMSITALWLISYGVLVVVFGELFSAVYATAVMFPAEYLTAVPAALVAVSYIAYRAVRS